MSDWCVEGHMFDSCCENLKFFFQEVCVSDLIMSFKGNISVFHGFLKSSLEMLNHGRRSRHKLVATSDVSSVQNTEVI